MSAKGLKQVTNEATNNVMVIRLHHTSELHFSDVLLICLYDIFALHYYDLQLVRFL